MLSAVLALVVATALLLWVYRSMQHPRLYLVSDPANGQPGTTWQALVRYLVLTPIMVGFWFTVILMILTIAAGSRSGGALALAAAAVVGAARVLAHISPEGSHELGKTIPLAVLSLILIGGSNPSLEHWSDVLNEIGANSGALDTYYWTLLALDVLVTGLWFVRQRSRWAGHQPGSSRARWRLDLRPVTKALRSVRDFGKTPTANSTPLEASHE